MKLGQFKQLAFVGEPARAGLVIAGLEAIGENVRDLISQIGLCNEAGAYRAAEVLEGIGKEESGKFLILLDVYRVEPDDSELLVRQFGRARDHLAKLIYAQIADYSIASFGELVGAVDQHRQSLYLDGPMDVDWIFKNELLMDRERALYVDLIQSEGRLEWWSRFEARLPSSIPRSMRLVSALLDTGLVSEQGLRVLREAWRGFDPEEEPNSWHWTDRTGTALAQFESENVVDGKWRDHAWLVADRWPMPMVHVEVEEARVSESALAAIREDRLDAALMLEYGVDDSDAYDDVGHEAGDWGEH